jgi:prepilin-type N-terminal cleavage/methylation domain-containing protein
MRRRKALTLIELLVVIAVASLLLAAAVPLLRMPLQGRKIREAAREVNLFLNRAKARAAELGRPVGVIIRRAALPNGAIYAQQLYLAESPPPYAGDDSTAHAIVFPPIDLNPAVDLDGDGIRERKIFSAQLHSSALATLVSVGDLIQFDFQSPLYRIVGRSPTNQSDVVEVQCKLDPPVPVASNLPPPPIPPGQPFSRPLAFRIFRSPIRLGAISSTGQTVIRSIGAPLDLPNGTVIDLTASGIGATSREFALSSTDVVIMFGPGGNVEQVYGGQQAGGVIPSGMIYLLIGRLDRVYQDPFTRGPDTRANLMDPESIWITVAPQTGKISTVENASLDGFVPEQSADPQEQMLKEARRFARGTQDMGGR